MSDIPRAVVEYGPQSYYNTTEVFEPVDSAPTHNTDTASTDTDNNSPRAVVEYGPQSYYNTATNDEIVERVDDIKVNDSHSDQLKEKKLSLVEFKIEKLQLEENNGDQEKIEYYDGKYKSVRSTLLGVEYKQDKFVALIDKENSIEKLHKVKVSILENKSCNLL